MKKVKKKFCKRCDKTFDTTNPEEFLCAKCNSSLKTYTFKIKNKLID